MENEKTKKLISFLAEKWKGKPCQMCGVGNWSISDKVFELREFNDGNMIIGNVPIFPVIPVTCDNCGNSLMINALIAGIETAPEKKDIS